MRIFAAAICFLILSACTVTTAHYYVSTDPLLGREGEACGSPWGLTIMPLADGLNAIISVAPKKGMISATVGLRIPTNKTVRFTKPEILLSDPMTGHQFIASIKQWSVGVLGHGKTPGYLESFSSDALLEGKGRNAGVADVNYQTDRFASEVLIEMPLAAEIIMIFPPLEVNGTAVQSQTVKLLLVEKTGFVTCK